MRGLKILAIFVGLITDIGSSLIFGLLFGIALVVFHAVQGTPLKEIAENAQNIHQSPVLLLASLGLGSMGTLLGSFVTGWMAKHHRIMNGLVMGLCSTLFGALFWGKDPIWYDGLGAFCTIGMSACGAYFADLIFGRVSPPPSPIITVHP
jgi:hypothetical protein